MNQLDFERHFLMIDILSLMPRPRSWIYNLFNGIFYPILEMTMNWGSKLFNILAAQRRLFMDAAMTFEQEITNASQLKCDSSKREKNDPNGVAWFDYKPLIYTSNPFGIKKLNTNNRKLNPKDSNVYSYICGI